MTKLKLSGKYETRYVHPKTEEVLEGSQYLEKGVKKKGRYKFLVDGKWIMESAVPEMREWRKESNSSLRGFLQMTKANMKIKERKSLGSGRSLIGKNEFEDGFNCIDKLQAHYDEQTERYGPICPITHRKFTFIRNNEKKENGNTISTLTNLSSDRMLNEQHYTKQNMLFTSIGWNLLRSDFSLENMSIYMPRPFFKNYIRILLERFPEKQDEVDQLTELENGAEHPQWGR